MSATDGIPAEPSRENGACGDCFADERPGAENGRLREECLEHVDSLYRVALRMTRNTEDAEDLVQDTYLKAVRSAHLYKQGGKCKAWLMRILVNSYIDRYRRLKREPREIEFAEDAGGEVYRELYSGREGSEDAFGPAADSDLNSLLSSSISDEVKGALDGLPEAFRSVVLMRYVEDLSYQEIAGIVGIPLGTVMSRLFRGRRLLGKQLWNYARAQGYSPWGSGLKRWPQPT